MELCSCFVIGLVSMKTPVRAVDIRVFGLVQGVGFRPFLHRLAAKNRIKGWALNANDSVRIHAEGQKPDVEEFVRGIASEAPPLARVENVTSEAADVEGFASFEIRNSASESNVITRISPDIAVCDDCLEDMKAQPNRIDYPFTNCTNCGPRFSIIRDLPYDRKHTTMDEFTMCSRCGAEYTDIEDRRYHAQPNACNDCGPEYSIRFTGNETAPVPDDAIREAAGLLDAGGIMAIKGIGGFHLACDALNEPAVKKLRNRKRREGKPFAVMCKDIETARRYGHFDEYAEEILTSSRRPIVLVKMREGGGAQPPAFSVSNGLYTIGIMLPYTPLHHVLFRHLETPILVMTSGNISEEPIAIGNEEAVERLSEIADIFLEYNRVIHNRTDDSVVFTSGKQIRMIRRSRGWAPEPVRIDLDAEGVAACGAEMKGSFCLGKGDTAIISQHIGDLKNPETFDFYTEAFHRFARLFRFTPKLGVCDLHPDYLSTRFAETLGVPVIAVQHHHAHIASVLAEHSISDKVIGVAMDGTGLGDDGKIWGGEFLLCDLASYDRILHFDYFPLPGGDSAVWEPWRIAVSLLHRIRGSEMFTLDIPAVRCCSQQELELLIAAIEKNINCPETSSTGRLFDAVAALTGLVTQARFDAEAPMRLEAAIEKTEGSYSFHIDNVVEIDTLFDQILLDVIKGVSVGIISGKFHNTIADIIVEGAETIRRHTGVPRVALSGGVFQNRYLLEKTEVALTAAGFDVYSNNEIPANDGGVCLGQLAVAAAGGRRER